MAELINENLEIDGTDFERQYRKATKRGEKVLREEPTAISVRYDKRQKRIVINLNSGAIFIFPPKLAQGLCDADEKDLADVKILGHGFVIEWTILDVHFSVKGLLSGIFGNKDWMRKVAQSKTEISEFRPKKKVA